MASGGTKTTITKNFDNKDMEMGFFNSFKVKLLKQVHFMVKVIKFVMGCSPQFEKSIQNIKTSETALPYIPKWNSNTTVPLKGFLNKHQYCFTLHHMAKILIMGSFHRGGGKSGSYCIHH